HRGRVQRFQHRLAFLATLGCRISRLRVLRGAALSWGSRGLQVLDSVVYAGYEAVGTSWGSVDVQVHGSRLGSDYAAVDIHIAADDNGVFPATFDVDVSGNVIASGTLPESDPTLNIIVENNTRE